MAEEILNKILSSIDRLEQGQDKLIIKVVEIDSLLEQMFTKEDAQELKSDILTTVDRFTKLHETLDQELVSLRSKYDRLEERLSFVENKLGIPA